MIEPLSVYFEHCEPDWQVPSSRTNNHILLLITEGSLLYVVDGQSHALRKGDVLFIPQGVVRQAYKHTNEAHEMYAAHFRYQGDGEQLPLLSDFRLRYAHPYNADYFTMRFSLLSQHWLRKSACSNTICHGILLELLALLNEEADSPSLPSKSYNLVLHLQTYILEHYREPLPVAELAALVERTPNYVSSIFRRATGQTLSDYIQQIRISAARDLLTNSRMNIGEISEFLGFCEQSYFNKVFKKVTGTLPSAYMKEKVQVWKELD
ncbi:helix-turn-helix domain-containing protein [Cohnella soli]|uniref:Helix-turn-helix domain-containing protein n=1 Tax=Cohnella soli TaxID=425005 RepID=A0ABW0HN19_9BACL